jgi:hypothetical protein
MDALDCSGWYVMYHTGVVGTCSTTESVNEFDLLANELGIAVEWIYVAVTLAVVIAVALLLLAVKKCGSGGPTGIAKKDGAP